MFRKLAIVTLMGLASAQVMAAECSATIEATDAMQFTTKEIQVSKSCTDFTVNLKHIGSLAKEVMGHNVAITKKADMQAVAVEGMSAGPAKDYINEADPRVIGHTKMIGGGESDSFTFPVSKLEDGVEYEFFCTFPGHFALMQGAVKLVD